MRILLVAEESAGIQTLKRLADSEHELVAVLASSPEASGRTASVGAIAAKLGLPVWAPERVKDPALADQIREADVDLLLNVHSLFIIDPEVAGAPRIGSFNLHPGLLPEFAGLNAPSWAIYLGQARHGVTVHWVVPSVDAGDIAYESMFEIGDADTGLTVSAKCVRHGLPLLEKLVAAASKGGDAIPAKPQDLERRRYFGREVPHRGRMPWSLPARRQFDFVRACDYLPFSSPWGHPKAVLAGGQQIEILKASLTGERCDAEPGIVGAAGDKGVEVATGDEWLLVTRVRADGQPTDARTVLRAGERFELDAGVEAVASAGS